MASAAIDSSQSIRALINVLNAQHSTGPRTREGKERVRWNALRHGAYSKTAVLAHEDPAAFEALGAKLAAAFQPRNEQEHDLLRSIQETQWRLDRVLSLEANLYAIGIQEHLETAARVFPDETEAARIDLARAYAYRANARTFDQFHRQESRLRRILDRAFNALSELKLQADPPAPEPDHAAPPPDGFVSQNEITPPHFTGPMADIKRKQWLRKHAKTQTASAASS